MQALWCDESGMILSAEMVTVGTVGVLGAIVGLNAASTAIDAEMKEMAGAIRSLDQSYGYVGHRGCGAWTAGSYYRQQDVGLSLAELSADGSKDTETIRQQVDAQRKGHLPPAPQPQPHVEPTPTALPNQIPTLNTPIPTTEASKTEASKPSEEPK